MPPFSHINSSILRRWYAPCRSTRSCSLGRLAPAPRSTAPPATHPLYTLSCTKYDKLPSNKGFARDNLDPTLLNDLRERPLESNDARTVALNA